MTHNRKNAYHTNQTEKTSKGDTQSHQGWAIAAIASIPLIMTLGNSMLIPVLPALEREIHISKLQSSYIITVFSLVAIFFIPIAGYLSDRLGRKIIILPSLIIAGVGGAICAWASWKIDNPFTWIIIGRVLQGIGTAGCSPIVLPLVGDMFKKEEDVSASLGIIETSNTFGKVLSPILGSFLAGIVWYFPFAAIPVFCIISTLAILFLVKKPKHEKPGLKFNEFMANTKKVFKTHYKWLLAIFFIGIIVMLALFAILFYLSNILEDTFRLHGVKKGFVLAVPLAALCLSSYVGGKVIKKNMVLMKWIIFAGNVLAGAAIVFIGLSNNFYYLIGIILIAGVGIGSTLPCLDAIINQSIEKNVRGTISSIYSSMRYIGVAAGPPLMAAFYQKNELILFILLAVLSFVGAGLTFIAVKPDSSKKTNAAPQPSK